MAIFGTVLLDHLGELGDAFLLELLPHAGVLVVLASFSKGLEHAAVPLVAPERTPDEKHRCHRDDDVGVHAADHPVCVGVRRRWHEQESVLLVVLAFEHLGRREGGLDVEHHVRMARPGILRGTDVHDAFELVAEHAGLFGGFA